MGGHKVVFQTESLSKRYGRVLALDGLSLDVRPGEVLGFLGPNGAGKTTTLRLLMGYLQPTSGSARVHGLDSWRDSVAVHARTGYLPGEVRLWPKMTARAIADHLARLRGLDHDHGPADLAKRLDLDLDRPVGVVSKGNRQKAGVLLALLGDPELLLLDEPTSGLDPLVQAEFHAVLRERVTVGTAVLLSSHVLSEVERVADRVPARGGAAVAEDDRPGDRRPPGPAAGPGPRRRNRRPGQTAGPRSGPAGRRAVQG